MELLEEITTEFKVKTTICAKKLTSRKDATLMFPFRLEILKSALRRKKTVFMLPVEMLKTSVFRATLTELITLIYSLREMLSRSMQAAFRARTLTSLRSSSAFARLMKSSVLNSTAVTESMVSSPRIKTSLDIATAVLIKPDLDHQPSALADRSDLYK